MDKLLIVINGFIHDTIIPTQQSLKSYADLLENPSISICRKKEIEILKHCLKRITDMREELLEVVNRGGEVK